MSDKSDHSKSSSTNPKESNGKEPSIRSKPDSVIEEGSSSQKVGSPKDVDNWSHVSTIDGRGLSEKSSKKPPPSTSTFKQTEKSEASEKREQSDKSSKSLSVISALSSGVDESTTIKSAHKSDFSVEHFIDDSSESAENGSVSKPKVATKKPKVEPVRKSPQKVKTPKTPIQQQSPRPIHKKEPVKAIPNSKSVTPKAQQTPKSKNIVSVKSSPKSKSKGKSVNKPSGKPSSTSPSVSLTNSPTEQQLPNSPSPVTVPQVLSPIVRVSRFVAQPAPPSLQSNPFIMYWNESVAGPIPSHNFLAPKSAILVCRVPNCAQGHASLLTVNFHQYAFYILVDHQQTNEEANQQTQASAQPQQQQQEPAVQSSKSRKGNPKSPTST